MWGSSFTELIEVSWTLFSGFWSASCSMISGLIGTFSIQIFTSISVIRCLCLKWDFTLDLSPKALEQIGHLNGFKRSWTVLMCLWRLPTFSKVFPHWLHVLLFLEASLIGCLFWIDSVSLEVLWVSLASEMSFPVLGFSMTSGCLFPVSLTSGCSFPVSGISSGSCLISHPVINDSTSASEHLCTFLTWFLRLCLSPKRWLHFRQINGLNFSWTVFMCLSKLVLEGKFLSQGVHLVESFFLFDSNTAACWALCCVFWEFRSRSSTTSSFGSVLIFGTWVSDLDLCFFFMWVFILNSSVKLLPQSSQLKDFFTLLICSLIIFCFTISVMEINSSPFSLWPELKFPSLSDILCFEM